MNKLLTLGSIVKTADKEDRLMIIGKNVMHDGKHYDYVCLVYPYGLYDNAEFIYINDSDIKYLDFLGDANK